MKHILKVTQPFFNVLLILVFFLSSSLAWSEKNSTILLEKSTIELINLSHIGSAKKLSTSEMNQQLVNAKSRRDILINALNTNTIRSIKKFAFTSKNINFTT